MAFVRWPCPSRSSIGGLSVVGFRNEERGFFEGVISGLLFCRCTCCACPSLSSALIPSCVCQLSIPASRAKTEKPSPCPLIAIHLVNGSTETFYRGCRSRSMQASRVVSKFTSHGPGVVGGRLRAAPAHSDVDCFFWIGPIVNL